MPKRKTQQTQTLLTDAQVQAMQQAAARSALDAYRCADTAGVFTDAQQAAGVLDSSAKAQACVDYANKLTDAYADLVQACTVPVGSLPADSVLGLIAQLAHAYVQAGSNRRVQVADACSLDLDSTLQVQRVHLSADKRIFILAPM